MEESENVEPMQAERSLLGHAEYETIRLTHYPTVYDIGRPRLEAMPTPLAQDAR